MGREVRASRQRRQNGSSIATLQGTVQPQARTVANAFLRHLLSRAQVGGVERLLTLQIRQVRQQHAASGNRDATQVLLLAAANANHASLNQVLHARVVNALGGSGTRA